MVKRICFFSVGFAFNRLIRLRYYEKLFPKDVEIFLFTTNKYAGTSEEKYQAKWDLERTKVTTVKYNPFQIPFEFRKFCNKNKIDAVSNLGHPFGTIPLIFGSLFKKRKVLLYFLGDSIDYPKTDTLTKKGLINLFILIPYFILVHLSDKVATVGYNTYRKSPLFFLSKKKKFHYIHAPVNTDIFRPQDKVTARKKLKIPLNQKTILFVGKVTSRKGGKLLREVIKSNPQIKFILIGKWQEKEIPRFKFKNMEVIDRVLNKDLPKYYSAADLSFAYHRQGCQMGIVGGESLACGTPILHTNRIAFKDSPVIIKISENLKEINNKIKAFFNLPNKDRINFSKESRKYVERYLSDEVWSNKYKEFFLKQ
jgi:glycosyltransferase involved in cell wall biosynthesis